MGDSEEADLKVSATFKKEEVAGDSAGAVVAAYLVADAADGTD